MNDMKERLIKLIQDAVGGCARNWAEIIADGLIESGVILPTCKVGDTVYVLNDFGYKKEIKEYEVGVIAIKGANEFSKALWQDVYGGEIGTFADIGKTVFLTKEEAELALNRRKEVVYDE